MIFQHSFTGQSRIFTWRCLPENGRSSKQSACLRTPSHLYANNIILVPILCPLASKAANLAGQFQCPSENCTQCKRFALSKAKHDLNWVHSSRQDWQQSRQLSSRNSMLHFRAIWTQPPKSWSGCSKSSLQLLRESAQLIQNK